MSGLLKDLLTEYFPKAPQGGALPLWMAFVSSLAIFNTIQCFVSTKLSRKVYSNKRHEVTPLSTRTFGIWTLLAAVLRIYAAYDITNKALYDVSLVSYVLAWAHFVSEFAFYRTAGFGGVLPSFVVASTSLYWMFTQRGWYLA